MAKISKPAIPMKMYRNFAVATVLLTGTFAMIADDENRDVIESEFAAQQASFEKRQSADDPKLERREPDSGMAAGRFAEDAGAYGSPMIKADVGARRSVRSMGTRASGSARSIPGYSQTYLDQLTEEEYLQLVAGLRGAGMLDPEKRREQIAALQRASRARSGQATKPY